MYSSGYGVTCIFLLLYPYESHLTRRAPRRLQQALRIKSPYHSLRKCPYFRMRASKIVVCLVMAQQMTQTSLPSTLEINSAHVVSHIIIPRSPTKLCLIFTPPTSTKHSAVANPDDSYWKLPPNKYDSATHLSCVPLHRHTALLR